MEISDNIKHMLELANRLNQIVDELKARAKVMFPEHYQE